MSSVDYESIGLKIGLEVHQQLATRKKLFCKCEEFGEKSLDLQFVRRLRPTQSELGQIDPAALFEFKKGTLIKYQAGRESACLVEADEEPPHELNMEALESAILIALCLGSNVVDEVHVMRKIVIDGSNTTGFQRTLVVALGGEIRVGGKVIPVQTVSLEEDAARLMAQEAEIREYGLDRLCVPLVEVALAPFTGSPREVQEAALSVGRLMRATGRVSRGLGTVRQDLNISVAGGGVVEVKGVQKLDLLAEIVEFEVARQLGLIKAAEMLEAKGLKTEDFMVEPIDVRRVFEQTECSILKKALKRSERILALKAKGFKGLFKFEPHPDVRIGKEIADLVRFYGLGGILHSDELPGFGMMEEEVEEVRGMLGASEEDGFIILGGGEDSVTEAAGAVVERLRNALLGVPAETRGPTPDGKTRFIRPRPGAARMYPETDISPIPVSDELIERISKQIPKPWEEQIETYISKYGLNRKLAIQIYDSDYAELFEDLASKTKIPSSFIAATLTETLVNLSRSGQDTSKLDGYTLRSVFQALDEARISKEAVPKVLEEILKGEVKKVDEALEKLGLVAMSNQELEALIDRVLQENLDLIQDKREHAFSTLMGQVMKIARGKVDGHKVSQRLSEKMKRVLSS